MNQETPPEARKMIIFYFNSDLFLVTVMTEKERKKILFFDEYNRGVYAYIIYNMIRNIENMRECSHARWECK